MKLKTGVSVHGLTTEMLLGLIIAMGVYRKYESELTVTSALDGKHSHTSLHYSGNAVDLRTRDLPEGMAEVIVKEIKEDVGIDYDVILEDDHIHLEYQPRRK